MLLVNQKGNHLAHDLACIIISQMAGSAVKASMEVLGMQLSGRTLAWLPSMRGVPGFHLQHPGKISLHFRCGKEGVSSPGRAQEACKTFVAFIRTFQGQL